MEDRAFFEKRIGTVLRGKWTLEKLLGVGGMAAVYVAAHKIGRRDAIKILHPEIARSTDLRQRFEQEAHAVNLFKHPGAVEIRDIDTSDDGAPFLVMELLEGESLAERARRLDGIATDEMLRLVDELLDVLAAAHAQGIVHRDIKLDNLFVQTSGHLKVLDFGIARMRWGASRAVRTRLGATLGTAAYMAPEQVRGGDVDHRVDLFAVGATMFRLVARRRIHEAATEVDLLQKMGVDPAPALASVARSAPASLCLVVDRALAFHRDRRYPDARTMQLDVQALRRGEPPPYATSRADAGDAPGSLEPPPGAAPLAAMPTRTGSGSLPSVTGATAATIGASQIAADLRDAATVGAPTSGPGAPPPTARATDVPLDTPAPAALRSLGTDPTAVGPDTASAPTREPTTMPWTAGSGVPSTRSLLAASFGAPPSSSLSSLAPTAPAPVGYFAGATPPPSSSPQSFGTTAPPSQAAVESTLRSAGPAAPPSSIGQPPSIEPRVGEPPSMRSHASTEPSTYAPAGAPAYAGAGPVPAVVTPAGLGSSRAGTRDPLGAAIPLAPRSNNTPLFVLGALFLLCGVALGLYFGLRESPAPGGDAASAASGGDTSTTTAGARPGAIPPATKLRPPATVTAAAPAQAPAPQPAATAKPGPMAPAPASTPPPGKPGKGKGNDGEPKGKDKDKDK